MDNNPTIVIFGAGAIGGSVGAWVAEKHSEVYFVDKGPIAEAMKTRGITTYVENEKNRAVNVKVKVIDDISQAPRADIVAVAVKNYSLDPVCAMIREKLGDTPVILAMQNGIENQSIVPKHFSKVVYCVISYNAWLDEPAVIGYQKRGPLIIGTVNNDLRPEMETIARVFGKGVETVITDHLQDAARSKMIVNLTNSLTTLIGHGVREISDRDLFQKLLTNLTFEGVRIMRVAGYKECKLGGMPGWFVMAAGARLPLAITRPLFEKNVKKMVLSSMAQDIIQRGGSDSELDTINGVFIGLADRYGMKAPYNRAIYELCKLHFSKPGFQPLDVSEVWAKVQEKM